MNVINEFLRDNHMAAKITTSTLFIILLKVSGSQERCYLRFRKYVNLYSLKKLTS